MGDKPSVAEGCGYVVTDAGRQGAASREVCNCVMEVTGRTFHCPKCLTVYGFLSQAVPARIPTGMKPA